MENLAPTPTSTTCPSCGEEEALLAAMDVSHYYRVTEIDKDHVKGESTGDTEFAANEDSLRLFCSMCGEYFLMPEKEELIG